MAILTTINEIPLFTTVQEALNWAAGNNCSGYHTHTYQGQLGYMGCASHGSALNSNTQPTSSYGSSGSSGGGNY